jgi:tight adherence protein C
MTTVSYMTPALWFAAHGKIILPMALLFIGGAGVLVWGLSQGKALPSRRLHLMQEGSGIAQHGSKYTTDWKEDSQVWYAEGLSNEERWQIVRSFAKVNAPPAVGLAIFFAMRLILAIGGGAFAYLAAPVSNPMMPIVFGAGAAIAGWLMPIMMVNHKLKQHRKSVATALPNALELLGICVSVGLSLEAGFQRVAVEIRLSSPALADEFSLTWAEISISPSREQALQNLAERVNLPSVKSVIGTLIQSLRFGTPLAQSLRNAATEMRSHQMIEMEERANRLPAMMTVPVMLFIMPTMFLIVGGPAAIRLMDMFK